MTEHNMNRTVEPKAINEGVCDKTLNVQEWLPIGTKTPDHESHECDNISCNCEDPCLYSCQTVDDFLRLTDEMMETIIDLEDELVRWRQALIKHLPEDWAEGLRSDIFNNLSRGFEGEPAYDLYVKLKRGIDPQQEQRRIKRLCRLADGTDETSITYL